MKIVVSVVRRKRTVCCKRITEPNGNNKRGMEWWGGVPKDSFVLLIRE